MTKAHYRCKLRKQYSDPSITSTKLRKLILWVASNKDMLVEYENLLEENKKLKRMICKHKVIKLISFGDL